MRSSPWPSSQAKSAAAALIDGIAQAGAPDVDRALEHNLPVSFATTSLSAMVHGETPALASTQTVDALGLIAWMFRDQLLEKINAAFDEAADDKNALTAQQREAAEAQISADVLLIERAEAACIWAAEAKGEVIDFRANTAPQAVLGVRLITAPAVNTPSWSSPLLAFDVVGPER